MFSLFSGLTQAEHWIPPEPCVGIVLQTIISWFGFPAYKVGLALVYHAHEFF